MAIVLCHKYKGKSLLKGLFFSAGIYLYTEYWFKDKIIQVKGDHLLKYFFELPYYPLHPLLSSLCLSIGKVNEVSDGYAEETIRKLVALKGKGEAVLEEILSVFSEVLIASHAVEIADTINGRKYFIDEPGSKQKKKNPEFRSIFNGIPYCVEVKKPKLINHAKNRHNPIQVPARTILTLKDKKNITYPRDNPIKDFLISAQRKFEAYNKDYPEDYRFLFIMWDDHMYETISSLLSPFQGLLKEGSFYKDSNGEAIKFPLIDGIVVVRHLHNFRSALLQEAFHDDILHAFQYKKKYPLHAFIQNPYGRKVPNIFIEAFDCMIEDMFGMFADYAITDIVFWNKFYS